MLHGTSSFSTCYHRMRKSKQFNGRYEQKETPRILIGEEILSQLKGKHKNYGG